MQRPDQVQSIGPGHPKIRDHRIWWADGDPRQRMVAAAGFLNGVTGPLQDLADHEPNDVDVVHHKNMRHYNPFIKTIAA